MDSAKEELARPLIPEIERGRYPIHLGGKLGRGTEGGQGRGKLGRLDGSGLRRIRKQVHI